MTPLRWEQQAPSHTFGIPGYQTAYKIWRAYKYEPPAYAAPPTPKPKPVSPISTVIAKPRPVALARKHRPLSQTNPRLYARLGPAMKALVH